MLYLIYRANHSELDYRGGQEPIVHLEADLHQTVTWAEANNRRWAFSLSNAGAAYTEFRSDLVELDEVNWDAVAARRWQPSEIKDGKQAEFLIHYCFPWHLVTRIGVYSRQVYDQVGIVLRATAHLPRVEISSDWYY